MLLIVLKLTLMYFTKAKLVNNIKQMFKNVENMLKIV